MFIELAEFLRCPEGHDPEPYLVLVPREMAGRSVVRGTVGCPVCRREYPIEGGVADFGGAAADGAAADAGRGPPEASVLLALLGLYSAGGYVVLVGAGARASVGLATAIPGVHLIGINAPSDVEPGPSLSLVRGAALPLRTAMARGVVVGREHGDDAWLGEAARVLLRGRRVVVLAEEASPPGVRELARGRGMWVGEKMG